MVSMLADHLADCWVEKQAAQKAAATVGKMGHAMAVQMAGEMDVVTAEMWVAVRVALTERPTAVGKAGLKVVLSAVSRAGKSVGRLEMQWAGRLGELEGCLEGLCVGCRLGWAEG